MNRIMYVMLRYDPSEATKDGILEVLVECCGGVSEAGEIKLCELCKKEADKQ